MYKLSRISKARCSLSSDQISSRLFLSTSSDYSPSGSLGASSTEVQSARAYCSDLLK